MALESAKLGQILRQADPKVVVAFFDRASESDRQACTQCALEWWALLDLNQRAIYNERARKELMAREQIGDSYALMPAAHAAVLACATLPQIKALGSIRAEDDDVIAILGQRRPPWLDAFAEFLCERELNRGSSASWQQVRALVRAGLCRPPTQDHYVLAAIEGIWPRFSFRENQARLARGEPALPEPVLADLLMAEADWLETVFWRLFEIDGTGEVSLANAEKYGKSRGGWSDALVELSRRGVLSRERLLDASLEALSREFIQFRSGWFSRFHEALQPTPTERAGRIDSYLNLLASSIAPTVAFAINAIAVIDATAPLPADKLLPALPQVLCAPGKAVVKAALLLLDRLAAREAAIRSEVCHAAVTGLLNETADVQKQVFALLERHADPRDNALRVRLAEVADAVVASLRPLLQRWLGVKVTAGPHTTATAVVKSPTQSLSCLATSRAITPVAQLDDLLHLTSRVLENPENPNDIERVLDGISRLCDQRPEDFSRRTGPLRKRALKWRDGSAGSWTSDPIIHRVLAMVILSWLERENSFTETPMNLAGGQGELTFLYRRLELLAHQASAGTARPLLSAPTHVGGWIDPRTLVDRWLEWQRQGAVPDIHEQVLALLRLAPEKRAEARLPARAVPGEAGCALRHALGETSEPGRSAIWLAAYRSAQPHDDLPALEKIQPNLGPDGGRAACYTWSAVAIRPPGKNAGWSRLSCTVVVKPPCPRSVGDALLPVLFHLRGREELHRSTPRALVHWIAQLWPANLEPLFARAIIPLQTAVYWAEVDDRETRGYLEPLVDSCTELRSMAWLALAIGLAAQDATLRGHAKEGLIAIVSDGRLHPGILGTTMSRLLDTGFNKLTRWAVSLGEVARVSPAHARSMADLLVRMLQGNPVSAPRDLGSLLELLFELLSETGVRLDDSGARGYLAGLKAGGKTARLAKQILAARAT